MSLECGFPASYSSSAVVLSGGTNVVLTQEQKASSHIRATYSTGVCPPRHDQIVATQCATYMASSTLCSSPECAAVRQLLHADSTVHPANAWSDAHAMAAAANLTLSANGLTCSGDSQGCSLLERCVIDVFVPNPGANPVLRRGRAEDRLQVADAANQRADWQGDEPAVW